MIKFAVTKPSKRIEDIRLGMNLLNHNQDPYLQHYGVKIDTNMTVVSFSTTC
jgi:Argonaute linker 2 domain